MVKSTALFIDTWSRDLSVMTVALTQVPGLGLVMRFGGYVGNLHDLTREGDFVAEFPILLSTRGYEALSSAGFVEVLKGSSEIDWVVGIQGMPWMQKGALAPVGDPIEVVVVPPHSVIAPSVTHAFHDQGYRHSNRAAADAAHVAVNLRAKLRKDCSFVITGQSDWAKAWELEPSKEEWSTEWEEEYRLDLFTKTALLKAAVRRSARADLSHRGHDLNLTQAVAKVFLHQVTVDPESFSLPNYFNQWSKDETKKLAQDAMVGPRSTKVTAEVAMSVGGNAFSVTLRAVDLKSGEVVYRHLARGLTPVQQIELLKLVSMDEKVRAEWIAKIQEAAGIEPTQSTPVVEIEFLPEGGLLFDDEADEE